MQMTAQPHGFGYTIVELPIGSLYLVTLLSNLNARGYVRGRQTEWTEYLTAVPDSSNAVESGKDIQFVLSDLESRNSGLKAVFGGSVKKPLMTKVSMRHLNEIVRERNQYSRDALEAWQDFINLKDRMDT